MQATPLAALNPVHSTFLHLVIASLNPGSVNLIYPIPQQLLLVLLQCQIRLQLSLQAPITMLNENYDQIANLIVVLTASAILAIWIDPRYFVHIQAKADSPAANQGLRWHLLRIKAHHDVQVRGVSWYCKDPYEDTANCLTQGSLSSSGHLLGELQTRRLRSFTNPRIDLLYD